MTRRRAATAAGAGLAMLGMVGCSPAGLLNSISRLSGDRDARRVGGALAYGPRDRQRLDVYAPAKAATGLLPVVIFFYGGGWMSGERGDYAFVGRAFAAHGFVAVVADYRLVPEVRFPAFVEDGAMAVRWVRDNIAGLGGDPGRVSLAGHSAGAHIAAMLALDRHFLVDAGLDPKVVRAAALLSGPYDFYPFTEPLGRNALGQWPNPRETQPISFARRDAPPLLLVHGTADTVVQPHNSQALAARLKAVGAPVELRLYPGKSHVDTVKSLSPTFRGTTPALADSVAFLLANSR